MKKILLVLVAAFAVQFTFAQDAQSVIKRFTDGTGIEKFTAERNGKSSYLDTELSMGAMVMPIKVTAKYPSQYRIEMEVQGQNMLMIMRDSIAWVKVSGQPAQKITDAAQIEQMAPISDIISSIIDMKSYTELVYVGQEGKGKTVLDVVSFVDTKDKSTGKLYFNNASGMLEKIEQEVELQGKKMNIKNTFKNYTKYGDGVLILPNKIEASTPMGNVSIDIKAFELDYPTAAWMFAEPKN